MKHIYMILIVIQVSILNGCSENQKNLQNVLINIRDEWTITITPNGSLSIKSLIDSDPMATAYTKKGVIDYGKTKMQIIQESTTISKTSINQNKTAVLAPDKKKYRISEALLFKILSKSVNNWKAAGLNLRISKLLEKKPLLENLKMQNKALHPTGGGVTPKKEP